MYNRSHGTGEGATQLNPCSHASTLIPKSSSSASLAASSSSLRMSASSAAMPLLGVFSGLLGNTCVGHVDKDMPRPQLLLRSSPERSPSCVRCHTLRKTGLVASRLHSMARSGPRCGISTNGNPSRGPPLDLRCLRNSDSDLSSASDSSGSDSESKGSQRSKTAHSSVQVAQ